MDQEGRINGEIIKHLSQRSISAVLHKAIPSLITGPVPAQRHNCVFPFAGMVTKLMELFLCIVQVETCSSGTGLL